MFVISKPPASRAEASCPMLAVNADSWPTLVISKLPAFSAAASVVMVAVAALMVAASRVPTFLQSKSESKRQV